MLSAVESLEVQAARFEVLQNVGGSGIAAIVISGDVEVGDTNEFLNAALSVSDALVVLDSNGGDLLEGLSLAKAVRKLGYPTAVIDDLRCLSACAIIWIAGQKRFLSSNALLGFHAAYNSTGVAGGGNAMVGAFYGQLGLNDRAIHFLTSASPDKFNFLTLEIADALGIEVEEWTIKPGVKQSSKNEVGESSIAPGTFDIYEKRDFFGVDIGKYFSASSFDQCKQVCRETQGCIAFSFASRISRCFLKSQVSSVVWNKNIDSGALPEVASGAVFRKISIHVSTGLVGESLDELAVGNIADCILSCDKRKDCTGFVYGKKQCSLKKGNLKRLRKPGTTAGIRTKE